MKRDQVSTWQPRASTNQVPVCTHAADTQRIMWLLDVISETMDELAVELPNGSTRNVPKPECSVPSHTGVYAGPSTAGGGRGA